MAHIRLAIVPTIVLTLTACGVPEGKYDAALKDATSARADADRKSAELDAKNKELAEAQAELAALRERLSACESKTDYSAELEELRRGKAAAEQRAKLFQDFVNKFKKMIDAGHLGISIRRGRVVLSLQNEVLFDRGKDEIKPDGKAALTEIAKALRTVHGRQFQVAGHTDTLPIKTAAYPSNWELSTARATEVVRFLIAQGVNPSTLSAAGYAEYDPIAPNTPNAGQPKNRRIEITLQPNIEELISIPELKAEAAAAQTPPPAAAEPAPAPHPAPKHPKPAPARKPPAGKAPAKKAGHK